MKYKIPNKKRMKAELETIRSIKGCYGTKEYSDKAGICGKCKLKKDCSKVKNKAKSKTFINSQRIVIDKIGKKRSYRI